MRRAGDGPAGPAEAGHVVLQRLADGGVSVLETVDGSGPRPVARLPREGLAAYVRAREPDRPRWTWDCTTRWYPALLRAGVRVERCWDLRLVHDLLRGSPLLRNRLWQLGPDDAGLRERPHLVTFLHDEVLVHTPADLADEVAREVRAAAAEAGRLLLGPDSVDLPLDVHVVRSWADAG